MDILIELLIAEKDKLISRLGIIEEKLNSLDYTSNDADEKYTPNTNKTELNLAGKSIQTQALEVLKDANRFLHKSEIADVLKPFNKSRSEKQLDQRLAVELGKARNKGIIATIKYAKSNQSFVWGSKTWLDDDGNIKKDHMYVVKKKNIQDTIKF
ncbi:hypothetical protein [Maribacter sp.]|uniref:hypothetical protein n=1 Tax=Maribacter sp. TaxID=1897614 RepID=UPI0025BB5A32|nr:hypothetical protein [Maribacter sp.]